MAVWQAKPSHPAPQRGHPIASDLVMALTFVERGGTSIYDYSGYQHHAPITGTPVYGSSGIGSALTLDGSTNYANISNAANNITDAPNMGFNRNFSIMAWVNPTSVSNSPCILSHGNAGYYFRITSASKVNILKGQTEDILAGATALSSGMNFVGTTISSSTINANVKVYLNGAQDGSTLYSNSFGNTQALIMGSETSNGTDRISLFTGSIGALFVWKRELSPKEVAELYQDTFVMFRKKRPPYGFTSAPAGSTAKALTMLGVG